jgi:hypothetical protein
MSYYDTIDEDLARAKAILAGGAAVTEGMKEVYGPTIIPLDGPTIYGQDLYAAYKLLESFVAEIERLHVDHTRAVLRYTVKGYQAGENADGHRWRVIAETREAEIARLRAENETVVREKRQQFAQLQAIRTLADEATGTDRAKGDQRESGALGAVKLLIERLRAATTAHE